MAFAIFIALFIIEVLIAVLINDQFIRPLFGDVLVVILIFFFLRSFLTVKTQWLALGTLAFSWAVEFAQYLQLIRHLDLQDNAVARTVIGTTFDGKDLLAYTVGVAIAAALDYYWVRNASSPR
ncbi:MAG: DUF2809 domain-containing protein [Cyanobacteria bacterium P01_D01_bin.73]